jgi:IS4 transposase
LGKCVPLKLIMILFYAHWEIRGNYLRIYSGMRQNLKFSVVDYRDPETRKLHRFVTTLPVTTNPGTIAILYFKCWTIEKTFNNTKSDFKETKAWSSNNNSLKNQMRLTAMSYNRFCRIPE